MIPVSKALKLIEQQCEPLGSERVDLADAIGRFLSEDIVADTDMPPFDRSQMDGYAVRAADTESAPVTLALVGESAAGRGWHNELKQGEAVRIMTGAPLPPGADAVQKIEVTSEDGDRVTINEPTSPGRYIVHRGKEIKAGERVLESGTTITSNNIAVPAAFGYARITVAKRPRVAILSTGSEIVDIDERPGRDQIRNSNSIMLKALCYRAGAAATVYPIVGDSLSDLTAQISEAARSADVLITTGGVSVGKYDLTKAALSDLGAEIFFERLSLKPGKPTVFGRLGDTLVFGLPGNPVSAAVTFYLFVRKCLLGLQGAALTDLKSASAAAIGNISGTKERDSYLPGEIDRRRPDGRLGVRPIKWHGSSDFIGFAHADALIVVPAGAVIPDGASVECLLIS